MICTCRDPLSLGVVHRADAPCYIPEQRTWVCLTDEEVAILASHELWVKTFIRKIEEMLRSKNT